MRNPAQLAHRYQPAARPAPARGLKDLSPHLALPGRSQLRFGHYSPSAEAMKSLDQKFTTSNRAKPVVSAGEVLLHSINAISTLQGKPGPVDLYHGNQRFSTALSNLMHNDLGLEDRRSQDSLITTFLKHQFIALKDPTEPEDTPEDNTEAPTHTEAAPTGKTINLQPMGVVAGINWALAQQKAPPQRAGLEQIQWATPPVNLAPLSTAVILKSDLFPKSLHSEILEKEKMKQSQDDSSKGAPWIRALMSIPWLNETLDRNDAAEGRKIFDERFYGMEPLKKQILNKIAARNFTQSNKGGIYILVGPPGTGKTAVAKAMADIMGRKYAKIDLAGCNDAHLIRGHSFTYRGSQPGEVVKSLIKAGSMNPVLQLDEIDKVTRNSGSGDPMHALLKVLDPDDNQHFLDDYLSGIPIDLSKVMFICTANSLKGMDPALLSRATVIQFDPYMTREKQAIATQNILPAVRQEYGFRENQLTLTPKAIKHIIQRYTDEGGVRDLKKRLVSVVEALCAEVGSPRNLRQNLLVQERDVDRLLDRQVHKPKIDPQKSHIGKVHGLYWSEGGTGGGILPVETSILPGSWEIKTTGQLGAVMKEAADVALTNIRKASAKGIITIADAYREKLDEKKLDIHLHFPEGSVPKEGPSAGTSTLVSMWSALTQTPVPESIAMTGEIDLSGNVLPIGGIRGKVGNAIEQGVKTIFLPEANRKDFEDLCRASDIFRELTQTISVNFVSTTDALLQAMTAEAAKIQPTYPRAVA